MKNIGERLKQRRLELGFTIEEISEKTRLTVKHIKAIEEGDISYFRDDLSYLRFFLKAYCDALHMDFDEIKDELRDSIDDYTTTFTQSTIRRHEEIEHNVKENSAKMAKTKTREKKVKKKRARRHIDISLMSLLAIVVVVLIGIIFAFVLWMQGTTADKDTTIEEKPPVAVAPGYTKDAQQEDEKAPEETEEKELEIKRGQDSTEGIVYELWNLKDDSDIDVEVTFGANSSFRALLNGNELSDPVRQVYSYKSVVHVRQKAQKDMQLQLAFGFVTNTQIKVNGKTVELPDEILNKQGSAVITLVVKGE